MKSGYSFTEKIQEHVLYQDILQKVVKNLKYESLPIISELILHIEICEYLAYFPIEDRIALMVGYRAYITIYGVIKKPDNFKTFMYAVRDEVYFGKSSLVSHVVNITSTYKYPIIFGLGGPAIKVFYPELIDVSSIIQSLPQNELLKNFYLESLNMAKVLITHFFTEVQSVFFYKMLGEPLEQGMEFLKNILQTIKKK